MGISEGKTVSPLRFEFPYAGLCLPSDCVSLKAALCLASDSVSLKAHSLLSLLKLRAVFGQSGLPEAGLFLISVSGCVAGLCLPSQIWVSLKAGLSFTTVGLLRYGSVSPSSFLKDHYIFPHCSFSRAGLSFLRVNSLKQGCISLRLCLLESRVEISSQ